MRYLEGHALLFHHSDFLVREYTPSDIGSLVFEGPILSHSERHFALAPYVLGSTFCNCSLPGSMHNH
jgi:hypothetical protein